MIISPLALLQSTNLIFDFSSWALSVVFQRYIALQDERGLFLNDKN